MGLHNWKAGHNHNAKHTRSAHAHENTNMETDLPPRGNHNRSNDIAVSPLTG